MYIVHRTNISYSNEVTACKACIIWHCVSYISLLLFTPCSLLICFKVQQVEPKILSFLCCILTELIFRKIIQKKVWFVKAHFHYYCFSKTNPSPYRKYNPWPNLKNISSVSNLRCGSNMVGSTWNCIQWLEI